MSKNPDDVKRQHSTGVRGRWLLRRLLFEFFRCKVDGLDQYNDAVTQQRVSSPG